MRSREYGDAMIYIHWFDIEPGLQSSCYAVAYINHIDYVDDLSILLILMIIWTRLMLIQLDTVAMWSDVMAFNWCVESNDLNVEISIGFALTCIRHFSHLILFSYTVD